MAWCPLCRSSIDLHAARCANCGAIFDGDAAWKPVAGDVAPEQIDRDGASAHTFLALCAAVCGVVPAFTVLGGLLAALMPGCTGGDSGPASGCSLLGLNMNWFMDLTILAFVGSFFAVPLGALFTLLAGISFLFARKQTR